MKVFSMFSGVGGFELGLQRAAVDHELVGYCEWDKYASQIYDKQFPGVKNYDDATTIVPDELPEFQLLVGGFPCQSFSVAGNRRGFLDDTRGTLFFDIARVLSARQPRYVVLENVKGLLHHDEGRTFDTILGVLADIGYDVQWEVLNSRYLGVPQNRERVYIVGHLRTEVGSRPEVFPVTEPSGQPEPHTLVENEKTFGARAVLTPDRIEKRQGGRRMKDSEEPSFTLTSQDQHRVAVPVENNEPRAFFSPKTKHIHQSGPRMRSEGDPSFTLTGFDQHGVAVPVRLQQSEGWYGTGSRIRSEGEPTTPLKTQNNQGVALPVESGAIRNHGEWTLTDHALNIDANYWKGIDQHGARTAVIGVTDPDENGTSFYIRRLTPTECERLQSFPDGWTEGVSNTQRYKMMGNAVTVNVVEAVMRRLFRSEDTSDNE